MVGGEPSVHVFEDGDGLARAAAEEFLRRAAMHLEARDSFSVALSGGSTPKRLFELLAAEPFRSRMPWDQIRFFWGDERTVPPEHPDSNFGMADRLLLSRVPIRAENVHRIPAEHAPPDRAAAEYEATLRHVFRLAEDEIPRFDLVFLGMGSDGHTASLFPGTEALTENRRLVVANWIEKLDTHRLTLTCPVFNRAACIIFLVAGAEKSEMLAKVLANGGRALRYPAQLVRPSKGELHWYIDRAAGRALDRPSDIDSA